MVVECDFMVYFSVRMSHRHSYYRQHISSFQSQWSLHTISVVHSQVNALFSNFLKSPIFVFLCEMVSKCITRYLWQILFLSFLVMFFSSCCFVWEDESAERLDNACSCYCLKQSIYVFFCSRCFFRACQLLLCLRKQHLAKEHPCVSEYKAAGNIQENMPFKSVIFQN